MITFEQHPTEPGKLLIKTQKYHIYKYTEEDLQAAIAAENEACAKVCESLRDEDGYEAWGVQCAEAIRERMK